MGPPLRPAVLLLTLLASGCLASAPPLDGGGEAVVIEHVALSSLFIAPGEVVGVEVVVANEGEARAVRSFEVRVDGATLDRAEVSLAPGERRGVAFNLALAEPGPHVVEIAGASFEVVVADPAELLAGPVPPEGPATVAA